MTNNASASAVLDLAFRPFFLLGAVFSVIALLLWGANLHGWLTHAYHGYTPLWHGHEMLFGFVAAILVGFLLTAVQNWTGLRSAHGKALLLLILLWLAGRLAVWFAGFMPWWLVIIIDGSFLLYAAGLLASLLLKKQQKRNYFAVLALLLLTADNVVFHLGVASGNLQTATHALHSVILLITLLMTVIGGRVIPMFTGNTTQIPPRTRIQWLDKAGLGFLWVIVVIFLFQLQIYLPDKLLAVIFSFSAVLIAGRCALWRAMSTRRHPLLWSLHLSYWFIPLGLGLIACHYAGMALSLSTALHALTVGAMGGLILSMISRVSLGHTGRPIVATPLIKLAFLLVLAAALSRVGLILIIPAFSLWAWWLSIGLWVMAYTLFLYRYSAILLSPRADR
ncbi:NnrS family protein [Methylophaga sp.]|uniref:NnrS family protein n=1 Tax=Methylophaga sp. TaxID=2024840 RepID=UPI0025ED7FCC|nr:NnrS family protein [Methylophaga sp.]